MIESVFFQVVWDIGNELGDLGGLELLEQTGGGAGIGWLILVGDFADPRFAVASEDNFFRSLAFDGDAVNDIGFEVSELWVAEIVRFDLKEGAEGFGDDAEIFAGGEFEIHLVLGFFGDRPELENRGWRGFIGEDANGS